MNIAKSNENFRHLTGSTKVVISAHEQ